MSSILQTQNLTKDFGDGRGVFDLTFDIQPGEIVGFVGPNGAGKSTTINLLAGLVKQDKGLVKLFGQQTTQTTTYKVISRVGLLLSESTLDLGLTAEQTFRQSQALLGIDATSEWQRMAKLLSLDIKKPVKKLSLGNKKKVGVINALLHSPDLAIMDEPTSGLDPIIQVRFTDLLKEVKQRGGAVFLSSHDLSEIQHACDRIIMIKDGKVILSDRTDNLLDQASKVFILKQPSRQLLTKLQSAATIDASRSNDHETVLYAKHHEDIIKLLAQEKFYNFYVERPSLEEMFREYYL
jgi:ABC-2 type transport system ATP-binding protein